MSNLFEDFLLSNYSPSSSECIYQKKQQNHIVIAVIVNRGKVLAASSNKNGTRSNGSGYSDYTIHKNKSRKMNYIRRHRSQENWNNPTSRGTLALYVLWNKPNLKRSIQDYKRRFKL
jgi:hypothetical protein